MIVLATVRRTASPCHQKPFTSDGLMRKVREVLDGG